MSDEKIKFTQEDLQALRERVKEHRTTNGMTWKQLADAIGVGESTLSLFSGNKYTGDNQKLADEVAKWFRTDEAQELFASQMGWVPGFQPTATAKSIHAHLSYAKLGNMITIIGDPGVGKTEAMKRFARDNSNTWVVTAAPSLSQYNGFLHKVLEELNVSVGGRSGFHLSQRVRTVLRNRNAPLLCIDESQHLGERVLEELRSIHDETSCGMVFCGNREVTRTIDGTRTANFAQRSSRISKREIYSTPSIIDVKLMLEAWDVTDPHEFRFLEEIARRPGGGALRQMSKVLELATMMANSEKKHRDFGYIREAADQLQAGMAA